MRSVWPMIIVPLRKRKRQVRIEWLEGDQGIVTWKPFEINPTWQQKQPLTTYFTPSNEHLKKCASNISFCPKNGFTQMAIPAFACHTLSRFYGSLFEDRRERCLLWADAVLRPCDLYATVSILYFTPCGSEASLRKYLSLFAFLLNFFFFQKGKVLENISMWLRFLFLRFSCTRLNFVNT